MLDSDISFLCVNSYALGYVVHGILHELYERFIIGIYINEMNLQVK